MRELRVVAVAALAARLTTKTPRQAVKASWRRSVVAGAGVVLAWAGALAGASTAAAASSTNVDCSSASLQTAIANAASGTKLLVTGTCDGHFTIDKDLSLVGQGNAVLDAQGVGPAIQVYPDTTVSVSDLRMTGGGGAGIDNSGTLTVTGSTVDNNTGFSGGGGIDNSGTLTLRGSTVSDNTGFLGGGITSLRPFASSPSPVATLQDSTVSDNHGQFGAGGIDTGPGSNLTLQQTRVTGNSSDTGAGGILNLETTTLNDSTVSNNTTGQNGGGIFTTGSLTLNDSTVSGNTAGNDGGGIDDFSGTAALRATTVTNNVRDNCFPAGSVAGCSG